MTTTSQSLIGKTALVTSGAHGVGAAVARALAADGADIAIGYSSSVLKAEALVRELKGLGARAIAFPADQTNPAQAKRLIHQVIDTFGRLDVLVDDAGVAEPLDSYVRTHFANPGASRAAGSRFTVGERPRRLTI
jgi:3-oxoacyl-[acyl-carrier protein] reductase